MTTEEKALALVNELRTEYPLVSWDVAYNLALGRAIKQHEVTKQEFDAFKQKVSDAVQSWVDGGIDRSAYLWFRKNLEQFIIPAPKPDPLVQAMEEVDIGAYAEIKVEYADSLRVDLVDRIRAALDALGFEIKEKSK